MTPSPDDSFTDAPCGYIELDVDGRILAANTVFLALVGRPRDAVVGRLSFTALLTAESRDEHETRFGPALQAGGTLHELSVDLVRPDGSTVPALLSANRRGKGRAATTRVIVFEARDRRRQEEELLAARRAADEAGELAAALARTLQQSFIPPTIPDVPGLEIAGAYQPAGDGREIGGDFYDVFQLNTGEWIVVIGDVCGKGAEAAVLTSFVRHTIRALAVQWSSPAAILRELNTALMSHASDGFCTVVILRLLKEDEHWLASVSSGGHPLPLLIANDGAVVELGVSGSLIGVLAAPQLDDGRGTIGPGDRVVLYTDGVTEARRDDQWLGVDRLMALVAGDATTAAETTSVVLEGALSFQEGTARDDIAIVTVRVLAAGEVVTSAPAHEPLDADAKNRALLALQEQYAEE